MIPVRTVDEVFTAIQQVKAAAPAFCTNFFPVQKKLQGWIEHGELKCESDATGRRGLLSQAKRPGPPAFLFLRSECRRAARRNRIIAGFEKRADRDRPGRQ